MYSSILITSLPWIGLMVAAFVVARLLIALSGAKWQFNKLRSLHRCQQGTVQSLSFVLTLPFFVMIMMLIVQVSQIMIGRIVLEYSAAAAARSASVWIPAHLAGTDERR